jgi:tetratricopeptide (TPR) repeat protein
MRLIRNANHEQPQEFAGCPLLLTPVRVATMKMMMKCTMVLLAIFSFTAAARAQDFPNEPYEFLIAKLAAEDGRFDEALSHIDKVIAKSPDDPVLHYERAMMLIDAGRIECAESELRNVVAANPDFYDANRVLGRILLDRAGTDRKALEESLKYLQAAFKANPDDLSTGIAVSQLLGSMGRNSEAERVLATMVERAPDQRSLNYNYAQILTKLGRGNESQQYLEKAVLLDPTFAPAIMQLLEIYQQGNDWDKAAAILEPLVAEDPMNLDLQRQQAYFYLRAGNPRAARDRFKALVTADPKDSRSLFYYAESLNDLEQYAESEQIYRQLLDATPTDHDVIASLGLSLAGQKKWSEAADAFNKLLGLPEVPDNLTALARTQLAFIDLQRENYEAAIETAKSIFTFRDKPNSQAINIALEALKKQKKYAETLALIEPLAQKFDSDPFVNARYIEALVRNGQAEKAKQVAALQAKLGTRNTVAAAEAYSQANDQTSALAVMRTATAAKPDDVDLQFELGSLYERNNDRKAAEKVFTAILEKNPEHAPTLNYLGYMWAESGTHLDKAHDMLTRAVTQEPNNGAYIDSLGWVYFRLGNLEAAEKYLVDAVKLLPRDPTVHEHLGDVLAKRGDNPRALQLYRTALDLDPTAKDVDKLRSKIAEIEHKTQTSQR